MFLLKVGSVKQILSESYRREVQENRHYIKTIGEILLVTSMQNIAQRGHREDEASENVGNVKRLLLLISGHDKIVKKRIEEGPRNAKYTSADIQNQMLKTLAQIVREQILKEIIQSGQFSILVDETKDVRKTEQLSLVVRYYHEGEIKESFLDFKNAEGLDAKSLSDSILKLLGGYGLDYRSNLVGQGYDGASVMSGAISGVGKRIQDVAHSATYVHCYAHRLNLVLVDVCKTVKEAGQFFALLQQMYVFVSGSYVHQVWLDLQKEMYPNQQPRELKRLNDTRWACRVDACLVVKSRLPSILRLLHQIIEEDHGQRAVEARGLLSQMDEHFVSKLVLMTALLQKTKMLSNMFQGKNLDLSEASNLSAVVIAELQDMRRNDVTFDAIWLEVDELVKEHRDELTHIRRGRTSQLPTRMEGFLVMEVTGQRDEPMTPQQKFRTTFMFPVLDRILHELNRRFNETNQGILKGIDALTPSSKNFMCTDHLMVLQETYATNQEDFAHEMHQMKRLIDRKAAKGETVPTSLQSLLTFLEPYSDAFYELYRLVKIACVIPVTSASCERSFSAMKLIKTYLRNSMGHGRLSDIGVLSIERRRANNINLEEFVDKFASAHKNRLINLF